MSLNNRVEYDPQKKAIYQSYLNYTMVPESSVYEYETEEIPFEGLEEELQEEEERTEES